MDIDMLKIKTKVVGNFYDRNPLFGTISHTNVVGAGRIARSYGESVRGRVKRAMRPALEVFDNVLLEGIEGITPVWTGNLLRNTYSNFLSMVKSPIVDDRVSWSIIANTYYAGVVNATSSPYRRPNYFGRGVRYALSDAFRQAGIEFSDNLN